MSLFLWVTLGAETVAPVASSSLSPAVPQPRIRNHCSLVAFWGHFLQCSGNRGYWVVLCCCCFRTRASVRLTGQ